MQQYLDYYVLEAPFCFCTESTWPRLQSSLEKPHWISVDFERFEYQDNSEPEGEEEEEEEGETIDPEKLKRIVCLCLIKFISAVIFLSVYACTVEPLIKDSPY